jgi:DNA helicase IV
LDRHDFSNDSQLRDIVSPLASEPREDLVRYSTVADAKGLESVAVILFGFSEFESFFARQQAYIGATRASTYLSVILDKNVEPDVISAYVKLASRH